MTISSIRPHRIVMLATAAVALAGFAAPGQSADKTASPVADTVTASDGGGSNQADTKKYCVVDRIVTGSLMPRKTCKTKSEWSNEGVDISKYVK